MNALQIFPGAMQMIADVTASWKPKIIDAQLLKRLGFQLFAAIARG